MILALLTFLAVGVAAPRYSAVVDARFGGADGMVMDGAPVFHTIGAAIGSLPVNGAERAVVFVRNGRYREKLTIDRPRLTLIGESRDSAIITFDATADTPSPGGGTYGTRGSFTLRVAAPDFRAEHLTIENAFDYLANMRKAADDSTKRRNAQGVALSIDGEADRAAFDDVRVVGHQDTLFPNAGRSWFHRSVIEGSVDFIFGAGRAVFEDCDIVSRDRGSATNNGYVTAPSTPKSQPVGFLFVRSRLRKETPAMTPNTVALGRPWHPFANAELVPSAIYLDCWMDDHVGPKGWDRMGMTDSTGNRIWWEPTTARFFEYHTTGPGSAPSPARRQLTDAEAARYTVAAALDGWHPAVSAR
jgi:pectinesterase